MNNMPKLEVPDTSYLKNYNSKNPIHESDREKVSSIVKNLVMTKRAH